MTSPHAEYLQSIEWFVGSAHGDDFEPDYRYDTTGWPFFVGIKQQEIGQSDFHIAGGIQHLETAQAIVDAHNANL